MQTEEILEKMKEYKTEKADVYVIETLGLFGSCARGEQLPDSDIDVSIRLKHPDFFNSFHHPKCPGDLKLPI